MNLATRQHIEQISSKDIDLLDNRLHGHGMYHEKKQAHDMPVTELVSIALLILSFIKENLIRNGKFKFPSLIKIGTYIKAVRLIGTIALKLLKKY